MKYFFLIFIFLSAALFAKAQVGIDTAADFTVKDIEGNLHHLYDYLEDDKLVVIDFFTTNCGPCQTYASQVSASYDYFGCNAGNVVYLGINWGSENQQVQDFGELWGALYPSISGIQGGGNGVVDLYQVISYPTVILIAPDRSIVHNYIWPPQQDTLNARVTEAGGLPMACTVNSNSLVLKSDRLKLISNDAHGITFQMQNRENQELSIYRADGRLIRQQKAKESLIRFRLGAGFYIATLTNKNGQREVIKFIVN